MRGRLRLTAAAHGARARTPPASVSAGAGDCQVGGAGGERLMPGGERSSVLRGGGASAAAADCGRPLAVPEALKERAWMRGRFARALSVCVTSVLALAAHGAASVRRLPGARGDSALLLRWGWVS